MPGITEDTMREYFSLADEAERTMLGSLRNGIHLDMWMYALVTSCDVVVAIYEEPSGVLGHDYWFISGGWEILDKNSSWDVSLAVLRVRSQKAAVSMAAHHGDFRFDPDQTCIRATEILVLNGGDITEVRSVGSQVPLPNHPRPRPASKGKAIADWFFGNGPRP